MYAYVDCAMIVHNVHIVNMSKFLKSGKERDIPEGRFRNANFGWLVKRYNTVDIQ